MLIFACNIPFATQVFPCRCPIRCPIFSPWVHLQPQSALLDFRDLFTLLELAGALLDLNGSVLNHFDLLLSRLPLLDFDLIR